LHKKISSKFGILLLTNPCEPVPDEEVEALQVAGMIFATITQSKVSYSFQFITYSRCREDGQYQVFRVDSYGGISRLHSVPFGTFDKHSKKMAYPAAVPLCPTAPDGAVLVGLLLVRNNEQKDNEKPEYLLPPIIRQIQCPSNVNYAKLSCHHFLQLRPGIWLDDEIVHGVIYLVYANLLSKCNPQPSRDKICFCNSISAELMFNQGRKFTGFTYQFVVCEYAIFVINISDSHWICACVDREQKRLYLLDSMDSSCRDVANGVISYFREHFQLELNCNLIRSPRQEDSNSCGIFTILNVSILLRCILLDGNFSCFDRWGSKSFSREDKEEMRSCIKEILHGISDVKALLRWID
jgi:Ulp1 protease family, C-terminal catalytic domain